MGIRELRDTLTATIRRVRAGESFEITHDGIPVATLAPTPESRLEALVASGQVTPASQPWRLPARRRPITGRMSASEAILEERARDRGDLPR